jgi:hypothetical protein
MDGGEIVLVQLGLGCALLPALFWETKVCQVECHWFDLDRINGVEIPNRGICYLRTPVRDSHLKSTCTETAQDE